MMMMVMMMIMDSDDDNDDDDGHDAIYQYVDLELPNSNLDLKTSKSGHQGATVETHLLKL